MITFLPIKLHSMKSFLVVWKYFRSLGVHSGLSQRDIRITRLINQFVFALISLVLISALTQVGKYLYLEGKLIVQTFMMLLTFGPLAIVFVLNKKGHYFLGRLFFIMLPLVTTIIWMIVDSSQAARIYYVYLLFPIPIIILFEQVKTQVVLVVCTISAFLISYYIASLEPLIVTGVDTGYFQVVIVVIWICLSFIMLRFFVVEIEQSESKLKEKNLELEEFSRLASHDMREPLRTIGSFSSLVKSKYGSALDANGNLYLDHITQGVKRMDTLLEDLSNYSMIDHSKESLEEIDLNQILMDVKNDLRNQIEKTKAIITNSKLPIVRAKSSHMRQLFQNLIANAIKFQPDQESNIPKIEIETTADEDFYWVSFKDNGIGIKEEFLDEIFLRFKRLHSKDKYEGTGLGLATCKRIVEHYKGHINIRSEVGQGTEITIGFMR